MPFGVHLPSVTHVVTDINIPVMEEGLFLGAGLVKREVDMNDEYVLNFAAQHELQPSLNDCSTCSEYVCSLRMTYGENLGNQDLTALKNIA